MSPSSQSPFLRLLRYSRPYRGLALQASAYSILNKIFDLAPPALIGIAVEVVVKQEQSFLADWGFVSVRSQLGAIAIASAVIWGLESVFEYAYQWVWRNLAQSIQHDLRLDTYQHVQSLELGYFEDRGTGELMSILNDDINQLERFLNSGASEVLQVITTVVIVATSFFALSPAVAGLAMLPIPLILAGSILFQQRLAPRYNEVRDRVGWLNSQLSNNLGGIATIKSFVAEKFELDRIASLSDSYRLSNRRAITLSVAFVPLIRLVIFAGFIATLIVGGLEVTEGTLAVGSYGTMVFLTQRLLWPLTRLGETLDLYQRATASTRRIFRLLDTPEITPTGDCILDPLVGSIAFNHIDFAYRDRTPLLTNFSLHVPAGQTIAVVGPTGSGKSTLVKLLLRLYDTNSGQITIDGVDIRDLDLQHLRQAIGWVSQDVFLFHGTVADNICYGSFDASAAQIQEAAVLAEADEFIRELPQGYDTIIGERGQKLSGGQRQRLAIARAILKDPPILILDEATSAVDNETEAAIQRSLDVITAHRTTIVIAHRLSTVRNADCIYVMQNGAIVERGTHDELVANSRIYADLWRVQTGDRHRDSREVSYS
ncbi:MAG: ABC transporter ATP-binding protein [Coleofasciculaceae cyanobacterium RL_1_1]|nr:ABC transporter ATP-binding protein [Coleofasciculaceae cyanobacterium RL_1_1]